MTDLEALRARIVERGYAFEPAAALRRALGGLPDWEAFAASWDRLVLDTHLPEGHRYRRRRHATLSAAAGDAAAHREAHQPHYQAREYNRLVGGIERWFEPVEDAILEGVTFQRIVGFCLELFAPLKPEAAWHIECHQFRIEARAEAAGQPTPEGVHRDGVDYVLVMLVRRENIASGTTTVHGMDDRLLGSFTLADPLDAALVDDARVKHGVTAVTPVDALRPAYRDVLVVTLRRK